MVTRRKKMPNSQNSNVSETILRNYTPAYLHKNVGGWLIEYYVFNPATKQLERKRIRLNMLRKRSRTLQEFRVAANDIVCTINSKLAGGWTPFGESENTSIVQVIPSSREFFIFSIIYLHISFFCCTFVQSFYHLDKGQRMIDKRLNSSDSESSSKKVISF